MRNVTIQHLKQNLSAILAAARDGARFTVTRHRRPVAEIGPAEASSLHTGDRFGRTRLRPAIEGTVGRRYLEVLLEDREGPGNRNG
jgi:prevent-host-death family protein